MTSSSDADERPVLLEARDIVVHGASYVSPEFAERHGRLGRSWGCPALRPAVARPIIDAIKDGGALFAYYPNRGPTKRSVYLRHIDQGAGDPRDG